MNIFETRTGFAGRFDSESTDGTLLSLFTLARDIRLKLGKQGYLLDNYLSLFWEAANVMLAHEAADDGLERGGELRSLCRDVIEQMGTETDHPLYDTALNTLSIWKDALHYQEQETRMNLLYAVLTDDYLPFAVRHFLREVEDRLSEAYDSQALTGLFQRISEAVGETQMETLNLRLKQRFLVTPLLRAFVQGMTNDLLFVLSSRDCETSRQAFQLLLDLIPQSVGTEV